MKRLLFILLMIIQAAALLLIPIQYEFIDDYGETIRLLTEKHYYDEYYTDQDYLYIDYEINRISDEIWEIDEELDYKEQVYVVLEPDETGVHHAVRATTVNTVAAEGEVIIQGSYSYSDEQIGKHFVNYGFESVNNLDGKYEIDYSKQQIVTIHLAPWGQHSVSAIENY